MRSNGDTFPFRMSEKTAQIFSNAFARLFSTSISSHGIKNTQGFVEYSVPSQITFVAFGVAFEVPVIVVVLVLIGAVDISTLKEWRSYVIVGAFIVAAIFTPPDVVSQLMLAIPLCLLYELGMLMARFVRKPIDNNIVTKPSDQ